VTASDHVLVDTLALLLSVVFHANAVQDRDGAREVLRQARGLWVLEPMPRASLLSLLFT
jgi:hypothetical protein